MPLLLALVLPNACKQKEKAKSDPLLPEFSTTSETVLVDSGSSSQPSFSPKGDRLLFVSAQRPSHVQAQVYEKDLQTGQETRITFQNGDVSHPHYHPKEAFILYSSSTDELKENPPLLRPSTAASKLPARYQEPSEIYLHSLNGLEITRLTDTPGFDGEARFSADGKLITWTRARNDKTEILQMHRSSRATKTLAKLGTNPAHYAVSPDGKWQAWIDWDASFGVAKLKIQKGKAEPVEIMPDLIVSKGDTEFSPDSKWLFWAQFNPATTTIQLWSYELETGCARKLTDNTDGDRRHPALSPDMKRLVYSATTKPTARKPNVQSRILQVGFAPPGGPCAGKP
jgi:Tol biopolymer transport system component